jgi:hypothetical protein
LRKHNICSGHGSCATRTAIDNFNLPLFSFCQCDRGYYGPTCENKVDETTQTYGSIYNIAISGNNHSQVRTGCNIGAIPAIERILFGSIQNAACSSHGFGIYMPTKSDGSLNISNAYRVQSRGVCFCEPGYSGEECLGGEAIPEIQGYMTCIHILFMTLVLCSLHQHRKVSERAVDDSNVSPRDFSVFVNKLPVMNSTDPHDIQRVRKHFEQFGEVYSVIPALHDENIFYFRQEQNRVLLILQKKLELQAYEERKNRSFPKKIDATNRASNTWLIRPMWYPRISPLLEKTINENCLFLEPITPKSCFGVDKTDVEQYWDLHSSLLRVLGWLIFPLNFYSIPALRALVRKLENLLDEELKNPETHTFERVFVTFEHQISRDSCLDAYCSDKIDSTSGIYVYEDKITNLQKHVNLLFPSYNEEKSSTLMKGVQSSMRRILRSQTKTSPISSDILIDSHLSSSSSHASQYKNIKVSLASEPDEVLWDALDTSPQELALRGCIVLLYLLAVVVVVFLFVTQLNKEKEAGLIGFLISLGVVLLNIVIATHWKSVVDIEQNYSVGKKSRSVYLKVLLTQLCITILAGTIGVFGYPFDVKNGYNQDWFSEAGGFIFRTILIEAILPPILAVLPITLIRMHTTAFKSYTEWMILLTPKAVVLDTRCASLMRTVILCCAFQSGLPILNLACALCLFIRYVTDMYLMENVFQIQRSGAELARALEASLVFATVILACMSWALLRAGQAQSLLHFNTEVVFFLCLFFTLWAISGYLSFKRVQKRDCCFGFGFSMIPKNYFNPFLVIHETFMKLAFGSAFFRDYVDTVDETGGKKYSELCKKAQIELIKGICEDGSIVHSSCLSSHFLMRVVPYEMKERFVDKKCLSISVTVDDILESLPYAPHWTAHQMREWLNDVKKKKDNLIVSNGDTVEGGTSTGDEISPK